MSETTIVLITGKISVASQKFSISHFFQAPIQVSAMRQPRPSHPSQATT